MPTTERLVKSVGPTPDNDGLCLDSRILYTSRQNGKDIAFYVFMDKEKLDIWGEDNRRPVRARERQRKRDIWHRAIR